MTKISDLSALTGAGVDAANDLITVVDMSETGVARNKKMTFDELIAAIGALPLAGGAATGAIEVPADPYAAGWNGSNEVPTKNDVYDKIESLAAATYVPPAVSTQTGTSYTAVLGDANTFIRFTNGSAVTFTIPPNSSVAFAVGTEIQIAQAGAGAVSVAAGAGVTINSRSSDLTLAGQYAVAFVKQVATDTWIMNGDL